MHPSGNSRSHKPSSRRPRGLGIYCTPDTATAMLPTRKAVLQSLLTTLLRRFLTPSHQTMNIPHDDWFREVALPIVADSDAHVLATVSAMALRSPQASWSIQGLFRAGKSRAAAILIAGLMALDPKEGSATSSFVKRTQAPRALLMRSSTCNCRRRCSIALDVSFLMERPASQGNRPIGIYRNSVRHKRITTGGTDTSDRTCHWLKLEEWQRNLAYSGGRSTAIWNGSRSYCNSFFSCDCLVASMARSVNCLGHVFKILLYRSI